MIDVLFSTTCAQALAIRLISQCKKKKEKEKKSFNTRIVIWKIVGRGANDRYVGTHTPTRLPFSVVIIGRVGVEGNGGGRVAPLVGPTETTDNGPSSWASLIGRRRLGSIASGSSLLPIPSLCRRKGPSLYTSTVRGRGNSESVEPSSKTLVRKSSSSSQQVSRPPIRVQSEEQQIDGVLSVYTIAAIVLLPTVGFVC